MTGLRDVINDIRYRRLGSIAQGYFRNHTDISEVFPRLEHLDTRVEIPTRSKLDIVQLKVQDCLGAHSCEGLARGDWRTVPWVMWQGACAADHEWFLNALFDYISADRPKSVVRALVHAYVQYFDPQRSSFHRVGEFLSNSALSPGNHFGDKWLHINRECNLFNATTAPKSISQKALSGGSVEDELQSLGIGREQMDGGLARAAFAYAYQATARNLEFVIDQDKIRRALEYLITWGTGDAGEFRYQDLFAPMATALLESLASSNASTDIQEKLVRYFVDKFGDPRLNRARWHGISQEAFEVAMRLLVRATLDDFTRVIDATANARHWAERKPFWLAYYESGAIEDAWVAFGPKAVSRAHNLERRYGLLDNASEKTHSALILRIEDLVVVEWSHNGRCRFFPKGRAKWFPEPYAKRYDFGELHAKSELSGDYLPHMHNWQFRFANRIYKGTGVRHPKYGQGW